MDRQNARPREVHLYKLATLIAAGVFACTSSFAQANGAASTHRHHRPLASASASQADNRSHDDPVPANELRNPSLWHNPGDISHLDLLHGPSGRDGEPAPPFVFLDEDLHGSTPKIDVRDRHHEKWRAKLGPEARPEVTANRLLWAVGYYTNDDYFVRSAYIRNIHLTRGRNLVHNGRIANARFQRKPEHEKKVGIWKWRHNPFNGTREFNGLRVMMALMNNWDLKDVNNAVYYDEETHRDLFLVSDIGATFGTTDFHFTAAKSKGRVGPFEKSQFITHIHGNLVNFKTPSRPDGLEIETFGFATPQYIRRIRLEWIGDDIPIADARWIGSLLGQLSHRQIYDAFRAGGFSQNECERYTRVIEDRIHELKSL